MAAGMLLPLSRRLRLPSSLLAFSRLPATLGGTAGQGCRRGLATLRARRSVAPLRRGHCASAAELEFSAGAVAPPDPLARLRLSPWEYLDSEEYIERYGETAVWKDYRRNHKGGIPPQKTRKTCIRGGNVCGNPCPVCRDPKVILDFKNIRLLEQFICPHQGTVFDPSLTGLCQKQQKNLLAAIKKAQEYGLLLLELPQPGDATTDDFANDHGAVSHTPAAPHAAGDAPWYPWYERRQPPARDLQTLRAIYKDFLKKD